MSQLQPAGPFRAISHRGSPSRHRENTLPGIADAIAAGADLVEIDVKVTADGEVVLLHDLTLERFWGDPRRVAELDFTELAALSLDTLVIPRLVDALELVSGTGCGLLIDMDAAGWAEPSLGVVQAACQDELVTADEVVWCGRSGSLQVIRDLDPDARLILSWDERDGHGAPPPESVVEALRPEAYNPHWPMVTPETIAWARSLHLAFSCWTVDDPAVMRQLLALGVDAMITNDIRTLREVADEPSAR